MSYTIIYDRRFIKCGDRYIPLALSGDNNLYEYSFKANREVRCRSWGLYTYDDEMILGSAEKIMKIVAQYHPKDSHYGDGISFHGRRLDDAAMYRFFENGIRDAMTIEDIAWQTYENSLVAEVRAYQDGFAYDSSLSPKQTYLHTSAEIEAWVENAKKQKDELLKGKKAKEVYICLGFSTREPIKASVVRDRNIPYVAVHRPRWGKSVTKNYVKTVDNRSISFSQELSQALVFQDLDDAQLAIPRWAREDLKLVPLECEKGSHPAGSKEKNYALTALYLGRRVYITRKVGRTMRYSDCCIEGAKRFSSEKEALRWYQDKVSANPKFSDPKVSLLPNQY